MLVYLSKSVGTEGVQVFSLLKENGHFWNLYHCKISALVHTKDCMYLLHLHVKQYIIDNHFIKIFQS